MWQKKLDTSQCIFALTSGDLPSAIAVVRLSGPNAFSIAAQVFKTQSGESLDRKRAMLLGTLTGDLGKKIDHPLVLTFVAPESFTGEDTIEFHCHGSRPIIESLENTLRKLGARPASRGEFSYRAFLNGKLSAEDLETLGDIFRAREAADLQSIFSRRDGSLDASCAKLRSDLIKIQATLDTAIDFSDEYANVTQHAGGLLEVAIRECSLITRRFDDFHSGSVAARIVLAGATNAGKSSLYNCLLARERAIVHEEAGTTRDVVEEDIIIDTQHYKLVDTAGIRSTDSTVEKLGMDLGTKYFESASVWLLVVDGTHGISSSDRDILSRGSGRPHVILWNKSDLASWIAPEKQLFPDSLVLPVSAKTGDGIMELRQAIGKLLPKSSSDIPLPTQQQYSCLKNALGILDILRENLQAVPIEYSAERARQAIGALDSIVGPVEVDQVLDRVFGEFCIGK